MIYKLINLLLLTNLYSLAPREKYCRLPGTLIFQVKIILKQKLELNSSEQRVFKSFRVCVNNFNSNQADCNE